ncbi:hypothetical protein [Salinicola aestuarinus]|uniref:hypothetical protein n=1 Tax=Salinicola aestuarinus TaxID=1949082 RepID=UPI000DA11751|nr:hypothetical protein [Salinicola aestuarinus]
MSETFCLSAECRRLERIEIGEVTLCRLRTRGGVYFFQAGQFVEPLTAAGFVPDERLVIHGHRLSDGTAWADWIEREDGTLHAPKVKSAGWPALAALLGVAAMAPAIILAMIAPDGGGWLSLVSNLLLLSSGFILLPALWSVAVRLHPGARAMRRSLTRQRCGKSIIASEPPQRPRCDELALGNGLHGGVGVVQGRVESVNIKPTAQGIPRYRVSLGGEVFTVPVHAKEIGEGAGPWFRRETPLFLAAGDRVALMTHSGDGEVHGVLDLDNGAAHVAKAGRSGSLARAVMLWIVGLMLLLIVGIMAAVSVGDWVTRGIAPDIWDWREALGLVGIVLQIFAGMVALIGLIMALVYRRLAVGRAAAPSEKIAALAYLWRMRHRGDDVLNGFLK